jgi:hypothetical protein
LWNINPAGTFFGGREYGPFPGWTPRAISTGLDSLSRLLWNNADTRASVWFLNPTLDFTGGFEVLL